MVVVGVVEVVATDAPMTEPIIGAGEAASEPITNAASVEVEAPLKEM